MGRNRRETRELTVFPAKAWFRHTPWDTDQDRVAVETDGLQARPRDGILGQTTRSFFWISSAANQPPELWNESICAHWGIENGSHYVRDTAFAEDASRIRKNPDIVARMRSFAYNLIGPPDVKTSETPAGAQP